MSLYGYDIPPVLGQAVDPLHFQAIKGVSVVTHVVDGVFALGDSLIGGPLAISGIVLLVKQQDTLAGDTGDLADLYLDGVNVATVALAGDGDIEGLFGSNGAGPIDPLGYSRKIHDLNLGIPSGSYDVRAAAAGTFKRSFIVVILNV